MGTVPSRIYWSRIGPWLAAGLGARKYQLVLKAVKDYDFDLALEYLPA